MDSTQSGGERQRPITLFHGMEQMRLEPGRQQARCSVNAIRLDIYR